MLEQTDGCLGVHESEDNYYLTLQAEDELNRIYSYGSDPPEFHRPELHTPARCEETLGRLSDGSVDLIIDDPPYGNTQQSWDTEPDWSQLSEQLSRVLTDDGLLVLFGQQPSLMRAHDGLTAGGFEFRYDMVWEKKNPSWVSHYQPLPTHESIWIFSQVGASVSATMSDDGFSSTEQLRETGVFVCGHCEGEVAHGAYNVSQSASSQSHKGAQQATVVSSTNGDRYPKSVLKFESAIDEDRILDLLDRVRGAIENGATTEQVNSLLQFNEAHPKLTDDPVTSLVGQKPWRLVRWLLIAFSERGDTVLDPHMGSGTVPDVCIPLCRESIGIEASLQHGEHAQERIDSTIRKIRDMKNCEMRQQAKPTADD